MAVVEPPAGDAASGNMHDGGGHGGMFATLFSAVALGVSGISFYLSALQGPELEVYVPPTIHYARDSGGDVELFAIPLTIVNDGARTGTVLSIELEVQNPKESRTKRYYSAFLGEHPRSSDALNRQFVPLSIPGRGVFSETVRFYPTGNPLPKLIEQEGEYKFRLTLNTATPPEPSLLDRVAGRSQPAPLNFEMTLPWISEQQLDMRRSTIAMHAKDWRPTASTGQ